MYDITRLKKQARSVAVGFAAAGMVVGNVASVAALSSSSLELSDPRPGETGVSYTLASSGFDTGTTIDCITLAFNDSSDGSGAVPSAMDTTGAALNASSTLITAASWTETYTTNGVLELTDGTEAPLVASGNLVFDTIDNGDTSGTTYFGLLNTYTNADCATGPVDSTVVAFVYKDGELVQLTIDPTLTFTCSGVAAATAVAGTTTTHASTGAGIDYANDVTAVANGIAAHQLDVTTNAAGGYTVYVRSTDSLTNANLDTIDNHAGTNLSPTAFPAAGTEAWGYNTSDDTLSVVGDGTDRFTDADEWAGFTGTNAEVMFNTSAAPSTDTAVVANQVGIASTTEAGTYQSTIIYTVVATF